LLDDLTNVDFFGESVRQSCDFVPWLGPRARRHPDIRRLL
jgi:hypothetical protein